MRGSGKDARGPFAGDTVGFYARYRRGYPAELIARLGGHGSSRGSRLLDLGCGTGGLALQLAPFFARVVGVDPEPDMLREAERVARERGLDNIRWIRGGSEELRRMESSLGRFVLVTIGTAFHFMEPRATLRDLQRIAAGGAVAVAYAGAPMWLHPDPWAKALRGVLEERFGLLSDVDFTAEALRDAEQAMLDLGYAQIEHWEQTHAETIDVDFVTGHILSATSTDQIPATERQRFAREVTSAIKTVAPTGRVVETVSFRAVIGRTGDHGR